MDVASPEAASAAIPSPPGPADLLDLGDALTLAAAPTSGLIALQLNCDDTVSFALPRAEVGQGITTTIAMLIAEELDLPLSKVHVTLADARPPRLRHLSLSSCQLCGFRVRFLLLARVSSLS